jgi:hypothetical protein
MTENEFNKLELGDLVESPWRNHGVVVKRELSDDHGRGKNWVFIVRFSDGLNYALTIYGHERKAMLISVKAKQ